MEQEVHSKLGSGLPRPQWSPFHWSVSSSMSLEYHGLRVVIAFYNKGLAMCQYHLERWGMGNWL